MGFFSNIARGLIAGVKAFAGGGAAAAPAVALPAARAGTATAAAAAAARVGRLAGSPAAALAAGVAGGALGAGTGGRMTSLPFVPFPAPAVPMRGGIAGGNGVVARQTVVQTVDIATGVVVRAEILPGAPFLMNSEVRSLRRVAKKVGRAHAKLPRRTVQKSAMKELTDAAVAEALRNVQRPCPPS